MKAPSNHLTLSGWQITVFLIPCFLLVLPLTTDAFVVRQPPSIIIRPQQQEPPWTGTTTAATLNKKDSGRSFKGVVVTPLASSLDANGFAVPLNSPLVPSTTEGEEENLEQEELMQSESEVVLLSESSSHLQPLLVGDDAVAAAAAAAASEEKQQLTDAGDAAAGGSLMEQFVNFDNPSVTFARGLILVASAVYGTNFAMVKMLDEQMPYTVSASLRFGLAAVVVTSLVLNGESSSSSSSSIQEQGHQDEEEEEELDQKNKALIAGMEIGGWYCLAYLCQALGLQTVDASKSAFFNALAVIVVPLLDSFLRGKRMGAKGITSVGLAILGVGLIQLGPTMLSSATAHTSSSSILPHFLSSLLESSPAGAGRGIGGLLPSFLLSHHHHHGGRGAGSVLSALMSPGDALCLGQAALFGIGYWRLEDASSKYPTQAGRITVGQLLGVAVGSIIFCILSADIPTLTQLEGWLLDPFTVGALVWTALVSTALALYLETVALKAVSATELTVLMTSVSLFGSAFAFVTMGETMTPIGMAGGLLILAGCVFSSFSADGEEASVAQSTSGSGGTESSLGVVEAIEMVEEMEILNEEWLSDSLQLEQEGTTEYVEVHVPSSPSLVNGTSGGLF